MPFCSVAAFYNPQRKSDPAAAGAFAAEKVQAAEAGDVQLTAAEQRQLNKMREAEERRRQRKLAELEEKIAQLEEEISNLEGQMADPANAMDYQLLARLGEDVHAKKEELDEVYMEWTELEDE